MTKIKSMRELSSNEFLEFLEFQLSILEQGRGWMNRPASSTLDFSAAPLIPSASESSSDMDVMNDLLEMADDSTWA